VTGTLIGALIIGVMNNGPRSHGHSILLPASSLKGALIVGAVMLDQKKTTGLRPTRHRTSIMLHP